MLTFAFPGRVIDANCYVLAPAAGEECLVVDPGIGIEDTLREAGAKPIRREGERDGRWVLLDFGDIVVHVQHDEEPEFYELERLWKDCPEIELGVPKRREA